MRKSLLLLLAYILPFVGYATTSEPPVITLNPVASSVCGGGSVSFTTASNDPSATYSWEYYDGSIWRFANNPALFSGIGTATLTVTNVIGKDGWYFRTQAINSGGESALSPYVQLTVDVVAPVASLTGANRVATGNTVVLNGTGSGRSPVWVSSNPGSATVGSDGSVTGVTVGYTTISYTISNACGTSTDTQRMEVFSTNITPSFTLSSPQSISLCQNALAMDVKSLLHVADADEEQNLTWTVANAAAHGTVTITGATASTGGSDIAPGGTITYQPTSGYSGADSFTIQVSDGIATATQKIRVTVKGGPAITTQPVSDTVCGGGTGVFTVAAGEPVLSYQWQVGGDGVNFSDVGFATSATFTVPPPVGSTISGAFVRCVLTGTCGAGNSDVVRFIVSSPNATINTVPVSCNGGSNGRATATVSGGLPPYTYSWSPVGGSLASATGLTARAYTVTVQDAFGCQAQRATTVTQPATITASVSDQTNVVCYGAATGAIAVSASGGAGALSYSWAPAGGTLATATGLAAGTYTCTITDTNSCSRTQTATITQPGVYSVAVTARHNVSCAGGNTGDAAISVTGGQSPFSYSWAPSVSSTTSAAGLTAGVYTATVTDDNGCEASKVITITEPAALNVAITSQTNVTCHGGSNGFLQAAATGGVPTYAYSWSPAGTSGTVATGLTAGSQTVTVTDDNGCTAAANTVVAEPALFTATISGATTICNGTGTTVTISADPDVIVGYTVNGGTVQHAELNNLGVAVLNTGNITGTTVYALTDVSNGVCNNSVTGSVTINTFDIPVINDVASQVICNNSTTDAVTFTGTAVTYTWSNSNTSIGLATSGSGNIAAFTAVNATNTIKTGTVTVTPRSGACAGTPVSFAIAVKPTPTVNANADLAGCNGDAFDGVAFTGNMTGTAYNWTNSDSSIGVAGSGEGDIFEFDGVNASNFTHTASVVVTPTNNGCTGSADTLTITVYPTPTVNATMDFAVCNGLVQPAINFTGSVSGTIFNWNNSNTSIGLDATNTTDIASFTAINGGTEPVMATVTVLPAANGCFGTRDTFTIAVNPTPVADVLTGQDRCNGAATLPVAFNSTTAGTSYTWSNSNSSIGLASTGTGNIASFAAVNSSTATTTATVTVTPVANSCTGPDVTMVYTVYPTPHMTPIADQSLCNGFNTAAITFGSSVAGAEYSWTNTNSLIGLALYGATTGIPSFPANNSGTATLVSTIVVTPTANECVGTTDTFTYTVTPTPVVFAVGSQLLCNTDTTTVINFGGTVPGTVYSWINSNAAIGLAATGTGDIAAFPAVNAGNVFDTATIVVLPSIGACEGATQSFNIVVKPTPTVDAISNQVLCNGAATTDVTFTGAVAGTANNWVNTNTAIGLAANGTGNILSFTATNTTVAPISGAVTVTPTANGCTGASRNFTYTVNPTPKFTTAQTGTVCSGAPYVYVPASATTGVSYAWTRAVAAGISNAAGSGSGSVVETLYNTTLAAKTATYHYTLTANGCSNQQNVVVTVDPTPQAPVITVTSPANVCSQTMNMNFGAATTQPDTVQYTWTADGAIVLAQGAGHQNAIISFPAAGNVTVVLTANATGFSCTAKDTFQVNVGSTIANNAEIYYIHDHFFYTDNTVDSYQWGYDDAVTLDSVIYTGQVDQNLYLPSPDFAGKKYWVMVNKGGCLSKIYYNAPTGVANVNTGATISINVYPNPATNNVAVSVDGLAGGNNRVELTDMTGKVINISELENNHAILNVNDLASGVYIISCYHNGVKAGSAKVVKE